MKVLVHIALQIMFSLARDDLPVTCYRAIVLDIYAKGTTVRAFFTPNDDTVMHVTCSYKKRAWAVFSTHFSNFHYPLATRPLNRLLGPNDAHSTPGVPCPKAAVACQRQHLTYCFCHRRCRWSWRKHQTPCSLLSSKKKKYFARSTDEEC